MHTRECTHANLQRNASRHTTDQNKKTVDAFLVRPPSGDFDHLPLFRRKKQHCAGFVLVRRMHTKCESLQFRTQAPLP